jgi:NAD(P)-dependent dehydrogenase (short-subunit alcohol dehydrogenase family)
MAQAAVKHMKQGSAIVNTGSVTGLLGSEALLDYSMTKGGIQGYPRAGLQKGHLSFTLHGERLKGDWDLVRIHGDAKKENWLLIKAKDAEARANGEATAWSTAGKEPPESVKC